MAPRTACPRAALLIASVVAGGPLLLGAQVATATTGPTAVDDTATVSTGGAVKLAGATNDVAGTAAIRPGLTVFPSAGQPTGATVGNGGRTIQVPKHGTFTVNGDGSVTFTAWTKLTGTVSVRYRVADASGATDDGQLDVVVTAGSTVDDVVADYGTEVAVVDLLANDTPGKNADGTPGTFDRASVRFEENQPWGGVVSADAHTVTYDHLGVATLDDHGLLTWRAYPSTSDWGNSVDASYTAQDTTRAGDGTQTHHPYSGTAVLGGNPNTNPYRPHTTDDHATTPFNASVTLPGTLNDTSSYPMGVLLPRYSTFDVGLLGPFGDLGPDDHLSTDGRKIRFPGRGSWTISSDGSVLYVPPRGYVGKDGVNMRVVDDQSEFGTEELVVVVEPGPTAAPDTATIAQGATASVAVLANDAPGTSADATAGTMDATFVRFPTDGQPAGATVSAYARTLTVPGQGVYTADRVTGKISFDSAKTFVGTANPVTYTARDTVTRTDGRVVHNSVTSTLTVAVTAAIPVAADDRVSTPVGRAVEIPVLGNDRAGSASAPLVASSIRLRLPPGPPDGFRLSADAKTLTVAGDGRFVARSDGVVVFTPVSTFAGTVPLVGYQVSDTDGIPARATIAVQVGAAR